MRGAYACYIHLLAGTWQWQAQSYYNRHSLTVGRARLQVFAPAREPSFAAKKFMADMFAMPSSSAARNGNGCSGGGGTIPLLFRNALPAPRPWEKPAALAQHMHSLDQQQQNGHRAAQQQPHGHQKQQQH